MYKKNFLLRTNVLINFNPILKIGEELSSAFQDSIRSDYPSLVRENVVLLNANLRKDKNGVDHTSSSAYAWKLTSNDKRFIIAIGRDYFDFYCMSYTSFSDFTEAFKNVYFKFASFYAPLILTQLSLDFLNKINLSKLNKTEWDKYIHKSLCYNIKDFIGDNDKLSRVMSQYILKIQDDTLLIFSYGIPNDYFPSFISQKDFVLDIKCNTFDVQNIDILNCLGDFYLHIKDIFEKSITDELRLVLNE